MTPRAARVRGATPGGSARVMGTALCALTLHMVLATGLRAKTGLCNLRQPLPWLIGLQGFRPVGSSEGGAP
eukprot:5277725-Pyramimonas_sp.AAC.1